VSSCATLLNGPVSDLEGALRRLSAEEIEQWFDLELELAIRSQKKKMTTMKTNAVRILTCGWLAFAASSIGGESAGVGADDALSRLLMKGWFCLRGENS